MGWKTPVHAWRFGAGIVNKADDFVICGQAPAAAMWAVVDRMMERLRLPLNATKTRCLRLLEEPLEFPGYRVGRNDNPRTGATYIGSRGSVSNVCPKISALTEARYGLLPAPEAVGRLNRVLLGWANFFCLGQASPAYEAVDAHAGKGLRQDYGLGRLKVRKHSFA